MSKKATFKEKEYMRKIAELGCIICGSPAQVHHCFTRMGGGNRDHLQTLPLCFLHHEGGVYGVSLHSGKKEFERNFGTEQDLLNEVAVKLACNNGY